MSDDVVFASGYFPIGLWLGPSTCLVYTDESPDPKAVADLVARLSDQGLREIDVPDDLRAAVLGVTMARVQDIAGVWAVWSADEPTARAAITAAVASEL
ncbi:MAG: hypothetical protein M3179_01170 [Actinomycetota bacterium]|nr:hypothetical protein [Actinomycetota bacterium]